MNKDFLQYYNSELEHLKGAGKEFAKKYPGIAGKIDSDEFTCEDPHAERLLDGFAGMAAKIHHKLDSGYPRLSQALIENMFPDYLTPIPSMGIVKFSPDFSDILKSMHTSGVAVSDQGLNERRKSPKMDTSQNRNLSEGYQLKKGTRLHASSGKKNETCQYRTAHDITLWPIDIAGAKYYTADMSQLDLERSESCRSCLCLELNTTFKFKDLDMDCLELYLRGADTKLIMSLYKMLVSDCTQIIIRPKDKRHRHKQVVINNSGENVKPRGFDIEDSLFPFEARTFEGYRLFRKYFALPQSFMFVQIKGILNAIKTISSSKAEIILTFDTENRALKGHLKRSNFHLFCSPIVNAFEQTLARIEVNNNQTEFHLTGDKVNPCNSEIIKITQVKGFTADDNKEKVFRPLYSASGFFEEESSGKAYYSLNRVPRTLTENEKEHGTRSNYIGTEAYISIADQENAPYGADLEQLEIRALCSNRDLPVLRPVRKKDESDFKFRSSLPIKTADCIYGPTMPYCDHLNLDPKETIKNISLNFLSLYDPEGLRTTQIIKRMLNTYAVSNIQKKYIKGIKSVKVAEGKERFDSDEGMFTFVSGLAVELLFDEQRSGGDYFLLGMIMDRFFQYAAPVNVFTKTTIKTLKHGEIKQWPIRSGTLQMI